MFPLRNKTTDPTIIILKSNLYDALNIYKMNCFFLNGNQTFFFIYYLELCPVNWKNFHRCLFLGTSG